MATTEEERERDEIRILLLTFVRLLIYFRSSLVIGIAELQQREKEREREGYN